MSQPPIHTLDMSLMYVRKVSGVRIPSCTHLVVILALWMTTTRVSAPLAKLDRPSAKTAIAESTKKQATRVKEAAKKLDAIELVRKRTGLDEHGSKLFSQAFLGNASVLCWKGLDVNEQTGRGNMFTAAYMAYRNPRAHREVNDGTAGQLAEFLLLNHLYILEREATER
jgi:hypothetical protein